MRRPQFLLTRQTLPQRNDPRRGRTAFTLRGVAVAVAMAFAGASHPARAEPDADAPVAVDPFATLGTPSVRTQDAPADLSGLRRAGVDTAALTDVTVSLKPDPSSQLKIRVYGSAPPQASQTVFDAPQGGPGTRTASGTLTDAATTSAASAWWAVETRLSSRRVPGHTLLVGNDLRVAPTGSGQGGDPGAPAADRHYSSFIEDRSRPLPAVSVSTGLRQTATDAIASDTQPWVAVETRPQDDLALRYAHGDAYRPLPATTDAAATTLPTGAHDGRAIGHSVSIEQQVSPTSRWTVAAFDNPARTPGAFGPSSADRLMMQGTPAIPHNRGVRLTAVHAASNGARLSVDYLSQTAIVPGTDPAPNGGTAPDDHRSAHFGRVAAALPLDGRWKLGAETVMVGRYGATPGYGLTHLVLVSNALEDRTTLSLHVYDVLDRRPADTSVGSALQPASAAAAATPALEGRGVQLAIGVPF